ncbi:Na+/H+ antiporter subunit E [Saccharibacillus kuerlensis]|uniref:Na(+)/H(+) antiporter subunit E n=1 Tax=Saccharibacillus kuerlensis TaxID=459527 RepID=A0ABQ2L4J9_9BACL|nr:Na+/H+ antiporter subunit E [Saccharibacillus kuerlensis]GGO02654.1 Na(+)/H(+) antiporter subunit E [Saccharibacillus kuerlensis]
MPFQILLNLMIAFLWMMLNGNWSVSGFIVGYVLGIAVLYVVRKFRPEPFYLARVWSVLKLGWLLIRELLVSSFEVIGHILRPKLTMRPGIFEYRTELNSDWEVTILSCMICLTPGTLTLEVSDDNQTLYIHALDISNVDEMSDKIRSTFEKAIMEVTRS